jgi:hypothetical protein
MALQSPALFSATIALSATHRKSLSYSGPYAYNADKLIASLKATSLRHLRKDLSDAGNGSMDSLIATIRTLCLCEVYAGADCPGTWRAHLEGARALVIALKSSNHPISLDHDGSTRFLRRWFGVTEDMVALTADGFPQGTFDDSANFDSLTAGMSTESVYLDEYAGYSTDLSLLFREIGAAARQQHRASDIAQDAEAFGENDILRQADMLEQSLRRMVDRDKSKPPKFDSRVANSLSAQQTKEFSLCNEASQHTALIHLARRVRKLPASSPIVQKSVKRILDCISSITSAPPSPLAVLTTPLFTAGCEALGTDRDLVRHLLSNMFRLMRIPNMRRSLEVLEEYWASSECKSNDGWESFMRIVSPILCLAHFSADQSRSAKVGLLTLLRMSSPIRYVSEGLILTRKPKPFEAKEMGTNSSSDTRRCRNARTPRDCRERVNQSAAWGTYPCFRS